MEGGGEVMEYVVVGDAEDAEIAGGEDVIAFGIVVGLRAVNRPVDFEDKPGGGAIEVDDEAVDDLLPAEVEAFQTMGTERGPQYAFGGSQCCAEFARAFGFCLVESLALDDAAGETRLWLRHLSP